MRKKRWKKRRRYPKDWKVRADACKSAAGWKCEECHEEHLTEKISKRTGVVYSMRLHAAHLGRYTKRPKLKALCPSCHARRDHQRRKQEAEAKLEQLRHQKMLVAR
jgi:hypothetical protein